MNKAKSNSDFIEIVLVVLLTFVIVFLLRLSYNRRSNNVVIKIPDLTSVTDCRKSIPIETRVLGGS